MQLRHSDSGMATEKEGGETEGKKEGGGGRRGSVRELNPKTSSTLEGKRTQREEPDGASGGGGQP